MSLLGTTSRRMPMTARNRAAVAVMIWHCCWLPIDTIHATRSTQDKWQLRHSLASQALLWRRVLNTGYRPAHHKWAWQLFLVICPWCNRCSLCDKVGYTSEFIQTWNETLRSLFYPCYMLIFYILILSAFPNFKEPFHGWFYKDPNMANIRKSSCYWQVVPPSRRYIRHQRKVVGEAILIKSFWFRGHVNKKMMLFCVFIFYGDFT